jgi:hypothetical protein
VRKALAFAAAVAAAFLLAACGPTTTPAGTPSMTSAPASPAPCVDADGDRGDPDGDCR